MKVLLVDNVTRYNEMVAGAQENVAPLQEALAAYTALGIATVPTLAELADMQEAPRAFLVKMLTNRQPVSLTGGITISAEKAYDMMEKPAGAEAFVTLVSQMRRIDVGSVDLVNGQVRLNQASKDAYKEQSRVYATKQDQVDEWEQLQIIAGALNTIRQMPRLGNQLNSCEYLGKMLLRNGYAAGGNPIEVRVQAVVNPYR